MNTREKIEHIRKHGIEGKPFCALTLEAIGDHIGVSRERVRQILAKTNTHLGGLRQQHELDKLRRRNQCHPARDAPIERKLCSHHRL